MCDVIYVDDATHSLEVVINVDENHLDAVINELDLEVNPEGYTFIRNGEEEINAYMQNIAKPNLSMFVLEKKSEIEQTTAAEVLVAKTKLDTYVSGACQSDLDDYTDECESQIDTYVQDKKNILDVCVNQCSEYKSETESILSSVNDCADEVQSEIADFNASVTQKQSEINASVLLAQNWATQTDGLVDETDYSAKKYALDAKADALLSKQYSQKASFGNIGDVKYTVSTVVPNGGAWCDGAEYTQAQFPDVYQMLVDGKLQSTTISDFNNTVSANGFCGFFGLDTSNERFKVPMLSEVYLKAGQEPVIFGGESLPNIKGQLWTGDVTDIGTYVNGLNTDDEGGMFYKGELVKGYNEAGGSDNYVPKYDFSRACSTYQDGAKVNPDHVVYRAYVVLYSSAAGASEVQAAEFIQGLSGKADTDLSNVSSNIDYVVEQGEINNITWEKWKSGKLIQRGKSTVKKPNWSETFTFAKPYANSDYNIDISLYNPNEDQSGGRVAYIKSKTTTSFVGGVHYFSSTGTGGVEWIAIGQGA